METFFLFCIGIGSHLSNLKDLVGILSHQPITVDLFPHSMCSSIGMLMQYPTVHGFSSVSFFLFVSDRRVKSQFHSFCKPQSSQSSWNTVVSERDVDCMNTLKPWSVVFSFLWHYSNNLFLFKINLDNSSSFLSAIRY